MVLGPTSEEPIHWKRSCLVLHYTCICEGLPLAITSILYTVEIDVTLNSQWVDIILGVSMRSLFETDPAIKNGAG